MGDADTYFCYPNIDTGYNAFSLGTYAGVTTMNITANKNAGKVPGSSKNYVSGMLTTAAGAPYSTDIQSSTPFSQKYGYFETRCVLPTGAGKSKGMWPAFWMMPADGVSDVEYDILEVLGNAPTTIYQSIHWNSYANNNGFVYGGPDTSTGFHTYGFQWDANNIRWYVDGVLSNTQPNLINRAMYLMLDLAVGGSWPGSPDANTLFPAAMQVQYLRVYSGGTVGTTDIFKDNSDSTGVTITGSWTASTSTSGYYGANYLQDGNAGQGTKNIKFTPTVGTTGTYNVYARWTSGANRATNVTMNVFASGTNHAVVVNQQGNGGKYVSLGSYKFTAGTGGYVQVTNTGANGYVIADSVKLTYVGP